jgi:hypothetical protein
MSRLFSIANITASQAAVLLGRTSARRWAGHYYKGRGPPSPWLPIPARRARAKTHTAKIAGLRKCCRLPPLARQT